MNHETENLSLEEAYSQLDTLLTAMEQEDHSLEETFRMYSRGVELIRICHDRISHVEKQLQILEQKGGTPDEC